MNAILKYAFFLALIAAVLLVVWWTMWLVGIRIPPPPIDFRRAYS